MFKRIMLTVTFIATFSTIGIGFSNQAQAWRGGFYSRPYGAYYAAAPRAVYYGPTVIPYRAYYAPRVVRRTIRSTTPPRRIQSITMAITPRPPA